MTITESTPATETKGCTLEDIKPSSSEFQREQTAMSYPLTIYRDIDSMAAVIADFKAKVTTAAPSRLSGLCGFDGFIDTFVRLQTPASMAEFGPKVAVAAGIATSFPVRHLGDKFGGNAPLFAAAINDIHGGEIDVTCVGAMASRQSVANLSGCAGH